MNETVFKNYHENLRSTYGELCNSYHAVDDFRAKLLALLPLVSGVAIFELLGKSELAQFMPIIGFLGTVTGIGLFIYELKGIQKCTGYIKYGAQLEKSLIDKEFTGQFSSLSLDEKINWTYFFTEPVASAIIYASVIGAWVYVATLRGIYSSDGTFDKYETNFIWPITAASIALVGGIIYWLYCMGSLEEKKSKQKKIDL